MTDSALEMSTWLVSDLFFKIFEIYFCWFETFFFKIFEIYFDFKIFELEMLKKSKFRIFLGEKFKISNYVIVLLLRNSIWKPIPF